VNRYPKRDDLRAMSGYHSPQVSVKVRLNTNESPIAPPAEFLQALAAAVGDVRWNRYPDRAALELRTAIGALHGVGADNIFVGNGSNEVLQSVLLAYGGAGRTVATFEPTYQLHAHIARITGATVVSGRRDANFVLQADEVQRVLSTHAPHVTFLCSPNNPTGMAEDPAVIQSTIDNAPGIVVVDEAYMDFVEPGATESMVDLARGDADVIVLRTFSKLHGLAGLRVGYAIGRPDTIARLRSLEMASPNLPGIAAATASLGDVEFIEHSRSTLMADRRRVTAACRELDMACSDSHGNFVFVRTGLSATEFRDRMRSFGIEVGRPFPPLNDWSRISLGRPEENTALIEALRVLRSGRSVRAA
jgi:histidinol-phosphate aminotransferase